MEGEVTIPATNIAGLFIRDFIVLNGPSSAYDIWKAYRNVKRAMGKKGPKYESFWQNYIYPLRKLGLIVQVGTEPGLYENTKQKVILDIDYGRVDDEAWLDPKGVYTGRYQSTGIGAPPVAPGITVPNLTVLDIREAMGAVEGETKKKKTRKSSKKGKTGTGSRRPRRVASGEERVEEFRRLLSEIPPGKRVYTPTELALREYEIEEKLEKHEKRLRRKGKLPKKKPGPKPKTEKKTKTTRKAKTEKKAAQKTTTKTTKRSKGKKTEKTPTTKTKKSRKKTAKKKEEKPITTEKELMAGLSPEEREFLKKILRAR